MVTATRLTPDALVTALIGAAEADFLAAQLWPLDLALGDLAGRAPADGSLRFALDRMPQSTRGVGLCFTGLRETIHALVRRRLLVPGGSGWEAGYTVRPELAAQGRELARMLTPPERGALRKAGQALVAATSMASKKPAASLPSGSATI